VRQHQLTADCIGRFVEVYLDQDYRYLQINRHLRSLHPGLVTQVVEGIRQAGWPAAGLADTEIRCFHLSESRNAEKEVQPRVQA
jgi:hypothetical protein